MSLSGTDIQQCGFMRSGNHYLRALLNVNFLDLDPTDWQGTRVSHLLPTHKEVKQGMEEASFVFYIWRDFFGVARSLIRLGPRFGVPQGTTLEQFESTPWRLLTEEASSQVWELRRATGDIVKGMGGKFKHMYWNSDLTPQQAWQEHVDTWPATAKRKNIFIVKYEELKDRFLPEMLKIASYLNSDRDSFDNVYKRVGIYPLGEEW